MKNKIRAAISSFSTFENKGTEWNRAKSIKTLNFILVVLVSFVAILLLNLAHPIFGDDWGYSLVGGNTDQRITNLWEILVAQYHHYFYWGGRTVVHIIAQFLLMIDEKWTDVLNSLAYVSLTLIIYKIAVPQKPLYPSILIIINLLICFFHSAFGSTMLWITGSANYLWGTLIILVFLLPYVNELRRNSDNLKKDNILKNILFLGFGIIAGWTNENMGVALIFMLLLFIFTYKQQKTHIPKWAIFGLIGACIGCIMMLAAPGNFVRYDTSLDLTGQESSIITLLISRAGAAISGFYYFTLGLAFIFALTTILRGILGDEKKSNNKSISIIFFAGAIVATLAMSASPIFPGRASYGINSLIIVAITLMLASFDFEIKAIRRLVSGLAIFGLLFYAPDYYHGYKDLTDGRAILNQRLAKIEQQKKEGVHNIIFSGAEVEAKTRYFHYYELRPNVDDWHNEMFSKYYQLDSVKFLKGNPN